MNRTSQPPARSAECVVCVAPFVQLPIRGAPRKTCSNECALERTRQRKRKLFAERYPVLIAAGAEREMAAWAARGGRIRFQAALDVLRGEST